MSGARPKGSVRPKVDEEALVGDPLDKMIIMVNNKGIEKKVPALHVGWAEKRTHVKYISPPLDEDGIYPPGAQEMWLELLEYLEQDLKYLLSLPHHRFWSQVVYDPGVHACLESYLVNANRNFDEGPSNIVEETAREFSAPLEESVHQLVLLVFIRMATFKESREHHITPAVFGEIIYENYLFDISKILDLCVLYGHSNSQLISKMVGNIFSNQVSYYNDLSDTIPTISLAFENIEEKLGVAENQLPVALNTATRRLSIEDIQDIIGFLNDTLTSIEMFLTCHPPGCKYFHSVHFELRLSACYENAIPMMMDILNERSDEPQLQLWISSLTKKIDLARASILKIFRLIIHQQCFQPLLNESSKSNTSLIEECVETFLQVMSTCIGEKTFIADYCGIYPVADDLELFRQHGGDVTSLDFITDAVSTVMAEMGLSSGIEKSSQEEFPVKEEKAVSDTSGMNGYADTGSAIPSNVEMSSLVSHVQDLLPDLGAGFIQECLKYYGYSTEAVINSLLEDSLPPSLVTLDRSMLAVDKLQTDPTSVPQVTKETSEKQVDFMDRANVYNNDEFDVFSRSNVDASKVHKGKKTNKFLSSTPDEDHKEMIKEIAKQYEERGGTSIYEDEFRYDEDAHRGWEYDDEYDDTYDDNEPGNIDVPTENIRRRPGIIGAGRLNTHIDYNNHQSSSEEDEEQNDEEKSVGGQKEEGEKSVSNQNGARSKFAGKNRGIQRVFNKDSIRSSAPKKPTPDRERPEEKARENPQERPRDNFNFCENPEDARRRAEQRRQDRDANRYRGYGGRDNRGQYSQGQENGTTNDQYVPRPKTSAASNRNSGKSWRQGQGSGGGADDDNKRYHGGKYKEDTNHGKAQSQNHRHKMIHKNEHKRQGAQAKFNRNN